MLAAKLLVTHLKVWAGAGLDILGSEALPYLRQSQAFCLIHIKHRLVGRRRRAKGEEERGRKKTGEVGDEIDQMVGPSSSFNRCEVTDEDVGASIITVTLKWRQKKLCQEGPEYHFNVNNGLQKSRN